MQEIIIQYGSWIILSLRIVIVLGLCLFVREYVRNRPKNENIRKVHHIVIAFVITLGVMLTQSIIFRAQRVTPFEFNEIEVFVVSLINTLITFALMVFSFREYRELLRRVNK